MQVIKKYSEALEQEVEITVIAPGRFTARTADGIFYAAEELELFRGSKVPKQIHLIKKVFNGKIEG